MSCPSTCPSATLPKDPGRVISRVLQLAGIRQMLIGGVEVLEQLAEFLVEREVAVLKSSST